MVYDRLTARYAFPCPRVGETVHVRLSHFRRVQRLPGPAHPAVYDIAFACRCGDGETACDEQCDDGNNANGDGCDQACRNEP